MHRCFPAADGSRALVVVPRQEAEASHAAHPGAAPGRRRHSLTPTLWTRLESNSNKWESLDEPTIDFAYDHGWIGDWDYDFYLQVLRQYKLTLGQVLHHERINTQ